MNTLDRLEVKAVSVVLNRVTFQRGRYYKDAMDRYDTLVRTALTAWLKAFASGGQGGEATVAKKHLEPPVATRS